MADQTEAPKPPGAGQQITQPAGRQSEEPPDDLDKDRVVIKSLTPWKNGA